MSRTTSLELGRDVEAAVHPTVAFQCTRAHLTVDNIFGCINTSISAVRNVNWSFEMNEAGQPTPPAGKSHWMGSPKNWVAVTRKADIRRRLLVC